MLAGGSARIPNVANRLQKEVDKFFGEEIFKVIVEDKPELTVWKGASLLSEVQKEAKTWNIGAVKREEY